LVTENGTFWSIFQNFHYIKSTFFSVHQQRSDLKTKYTLIKVSQKKHGLVLLALVSKFENDGSTSPSGKK
jgi:hypothetical protein